MQSPRSRALIGVAALIVVVALFFVLRGGDDESSTTSSTTTTPTTDSGGGEQTSTTTESGGGGSDVPVIEVKDGLPVGGVQELTFTEGDEIRFEVDSDVADEVHFHGYDVGMDVEAGGSVSFDVPATIAGVFEVELEQRVEQIAEITVNPG